MKVVHGPLFFDPPASRSTLDLTHAVGTRRPRTSRDTRLLIVALLFLGLVLALLAVAAHIAFPADEPVRAPLVYSRAIVDHRLDAATFAAIASGDSEAASEAVAKTSSDAATLQPLSAEDARVKNALTPPALDVGPPARPFKVALGDGIGFGRALDCMTAAIYYEAANEPLEGQRAVAQVVINRTRHVAYPHSVCGVVYQGMERATGCQFSFTCDGSLTRTPAAALWARARSVASMALSGLVYAPVGLATHYHADYVVPYWAPTLVKQTAIGRHIFYRWPGGWGTPRSFVSGYDAQEPDIWAGRMTATMAVPGGPRLPATAVETSERPVLMAGAAAGGHVVAAAAPVDAPADGSKDRVYLMSRQPHAAASAPPTRPSGSVTGGVIMPGTATLPVGTRNIEQADRSKASGASEE